MHAKASQTEFLGNWEAWIRKPSNTQTQYASLMIVTEKGTGGFATTPEC